MRALIWITAVIGILWSGYWFVGKAAVERSTEAFLANLAAEGIKIDTSERGVAGFPNRFDLTFSDLDVAVAQTGFDWSAPFLQIFSLSYKPWHIIAAFAPEQRINGIKVTNTKLQASLVLKPVPDLPLNRTTLIGDGMTITLPTGQGFSAETLRFATRQAVDDGTAHQIGLDLLGVTLSGDLPPLSNRIEKLHLDATAQFSAPLDRFAGETRPRMTRLQLTEALFVWDDLKFHLSGDVSATDGLPRGTLTLRTENWRKLVPILRDLGGLNPQVLTNLETTMASFSVTTNGVEVLTVPITVSEGQMRLGFLPLGPFPFMN